MCYKFLIWWLFRCFFIKKRVILIVIKYGINTFGLFGFYARNEANENSDLDFVMDKGDLKGLQYVSLVQDLR